MCELLAFRTPHERGFLVFGVPNAKYLAFGTPNGVALLLGENLLYLWLLSFYTFNVLSVSKIIYIYIYIYIL